jgi:hypothetical protein
LGRGSAARRSDIGGAFGAFKSRPWSSRSRTTQPANNIGISA